MINKLYSKIIAQSHLRKHFQPAHQSSSKMVNVALSMIAIKYKRLLLLTATVLVNCTLPLPMFYVASTASLYKVSTCAACCTICAESMALKVATSRMVCSLWLACCIRYWSTSCKNTYAAINWVQSVTCCRQAQLQVVHIFHACGCLLLPYSATMII